jgi:hypothetical protein
MPLRLAPLIKSLSIQDKEANLRPFPLDDRFAWAQREYLATIEREYAAGRPIRLIVLKARQLGISTVTGAVLFWWCFLHENTNSMVIAHENKASSSLFEKTKLFWETWPFKPIYSLERSTLHKLKWAETRSSLEISSARNVESGRGQTLHAVHLSEFASYPNPTELMTGLRQTIPERPRTLIVIESTAKGVGNLFHELWTSSTLKHNDLIPLFFPWWMHYEYRRPSRLTRTDLDPDERRYLNIFTKTGNPDVTYQTLRPTISEDEAFQALEWRRWAIPNLEHHDEDGFMQEYPATPHEAFISSGRNVFPLRALDACYVPKKGVRGMLMKLPSGGYKFLPEPSGRLTLYKKPSEVRNPDLYFVGADPSRSTTGDPACVQVINRRTHEQVAVWHGHMDPQHLAHEIMAIGHYFHDAEVCPEVEGGGQLAVGVILEAGYPRVWQDRRADRMPGKVMNAFGWQTNYDRKHWAIGHLIYLLGERSITIHDAETYAEMRDYVSYESGEMGNGDGSDHDDTVMALAIACIASATVGPYVPQSARGPREALDLYSEAGG